MFRVCTLPPASFSLLLAHTPPTIPTAGNLLDMDLSRYEVLDVSRCKGVTGAWVGVWIRVCVVVLGFSHTDLKV